MVPMTDVIKGQWFLMLWRFKRIMVPISEVNIVEGQYERSVEGAVTTENGSVIFEVKVKDSIENEMLKSITACSLPMGTSDVLFLDDSIFDGTRGKWPP